MSSFQVAHEMNQFENSDKYYHESTGDSGFLSSTNSATFSSSSEVFSNNLSEDCMPMKNVVNGNDFGLTEGLNQLSLNKCLNSNNTWDSKTQLETISESDSGNVSMNYISEQQESTCQEPWELYFTQNEDGDTFLHMAIIQNWMEATLKIINMAPHPCLFDILNDDTQTALHLAVMTNQPQVVRSLVLAGADLSIRNGQGNTALHLACMSGDLECAKALTEHITSCKMSSKQNLEQKNYNGETCLHIAASKDHVELVALLIHLGADLEAQECLGGRTALHLALEHGSLKTFLYLVHKCQPHLDATTYSGYTALHIASCVDEQIANELIKLGATPLRMQNEEDESNEFREMSGFITATIA